MDTGISWSRDGTEWAFVSSDQKKVINTIRRLKEQRPGEVEILVEPEDNDGTLLANVPRSWVRIAPPVKLNLSDEERQNRRARMLALNHVETT